MKQNVKTEKKRGKEEKEHFHVKRNSFTNVMKVYQILHALPKTLKSKSMFYPIYLLSISKPRDSQHCMLNTRINE